METETETETEIETKTETRMRLRRRRRRGGGGDGVAETGWRRIRRQRRGVRQRRPSRSAELLNRSMSDGNRRGSCRGCGDPVGINGPRRRPRAGISGSLYERGQQRSQDDRRSAGSAGSAGSFGRLVTRPILQSVVSSAGGPLTGSMGDHRSVAARGCQSLR